MSFRQLNVSDVHHSPYSLSRCLFLSLLYVNHPSLHLTIYRFMNMYVCIHIYLLFFFHLVAEMSFRQLNVSDVHHSPYSLSRYIIFFIVFMCRSPYPSFGLSHSLSHFTSHNIQGSYLLSTWARICQILGKFSSSLFLFLSCVCMCVHLCLCVCLCVCVCVCVCMCVCVCLKWKAIDDVIFATLE